MSSETPDIETYLFVKENISKYLLNIDITSKALKNKLIEVNTTLKFEDKDPNEKKSYYEIVYASIVKVDDDVKEKKELEKIILCDVPSKIYPNLETSFLNLVHNSGHPGVKLEKKIDFQKLYNERFS
jgi:preprotein translocase subunit SecB